MKAPEPPGPSSVYRPQLGWQIGMSSFWFATSFKWFILFFLLSGQVEKVVPGGEKNSYWGLIVAIGAIEAMIGPGIYGYLSDRCRSRFGRRRPFIAIGGALTALSLLFLGAANQMWMFVLGYLLLQISDDIGTGPYSAMIPDYVPESERGRASGIMGLLKLLAQIAAAAAGLMLGGQIMLLYIVMAALNIGTALWVVATVKESAYPIESTAGSWSLSETFKGLWKPFREPDFRWVWLTSFLNAFGFYLILIYLRYYLKDRVLDLGSVAPEDVSGYVLGKAVVLSVIISLSGAFAAMAAGKLADRLGRKKVIIFSGWIMFLTLIPFALIPNYTMMQLLAVVFGIGYGAYLSSDWALVSDILQSAGESGKDMGLWQMSVATPQVITGGLGILIDAVNRQTMPNYQGYSVAFFIAAFGFLFGSTLVKKVKGST
ncbi:MAG: MFS transporter [Fimbriimonadaceae bacterium]|nr:MFS transporter [Fimbriimonadaceae bacterium]